MSLMIGTMVLIDSSIPSGWLLRCRLRNFEAKQIERKNMRKRKKKRKLMKISYLDVNGKLKEGKEKINCRANATFPNFPHLNPRKMVKILNHFCWRPNKIKSVAFPFVFLSFVLSRTKHMSSKNQALPIIFQT